MKTRILFFAAILIASLSVNAQQKATDSTAKHCCVQEFGIGINSNAQFNIAYDIAIKRTMFRVSANALAFSVSGTSNAEGSSGPTYSYGTNLMLSVLRVKPLTHRIDFIWGVVGGVSLSGGTGAFTDYPFAGLALGLKFNISKCFSLYAEVDPALFTAVRTGWLAPDGTNGQSDPFIPVYSYTYGISSVSINGAYFTLAYKLGKK